MKASLNDKPQTMISVSAASVRNLRTALQIAASVMLISATVFAKPICRAYVSRFGPREQHSSACLLCNRNRVQSKLYGFPLEDEVSSNEVSNWIDTFYPRNHEHQWIEYCCEMRLKWTLRQPIGCCEGFVALATIYGQRAEIGEEKCQRLALKFHSLIQPENDFAEYDDFANDVRDIPDWLLEN